LTLWGFNLGFFAQTAMSMSELLRMLLLPVLRFLSFLDPSCKLRIIERPAASPSRLDPVNTALRRIDRLSRLVRNAATSGALFELLAKNE
jgi:hypothetical protein